MLLTLAYRSLSRPSSPLSSKASAIDLYSLDHIIISALLPLFPLNSRRQAGGSRFHSEPKLLTFTNFRRLQKLKSLFHYVFLPLLFQRTMKDSGITFVLLVENRGFEPLTFGLQSRRSSQLS